MRNSGYIGMLRWNYPGFKSSSDPRMIYFTLSIIFLWYAKEFHFFFIAHFLLVKNTYKNPYSLKAVKRNRCGKIKARGCADGRPQREYISKEESSSPTVSIYVLMTSCLMDAIEGR
jgi:hypothetical protein